MLGVAIGIDLHARCGSRRSGRRRSRTRSKDGVAGRLPAAGVEQRCARRRRRRRRHRRRRRPARRPRATRPRERAGPFRGPAAVPVAARERPHGPRRRRRPAAHPGSHDPRSRHRGADHAQPRRPDSGQPAGQPRIEGCWSFTRQQDAQAVAGRTCPTPTPSTAARPSTATGWPARSCRSTPTAGRRSPSAPTCPPQHRDQGQLVAPAKAKYFGVAEDGIPGDDGLLDKLVHPGRQGTQHDRVVQPLGRAVRPRPRCRALLGARRAAGDHLDARPQGQQERRRHLPVRRSSTARGTDYILRYAGTWCARASRSCSASPRAQRQLVPWSAGGNRASSAATAARRSSQHPALFRAAWQHVWSCSTRSAPTRRHLVLLGREHRRRLPNTTDRSKTTYGQTAVADSYPGDQYVDWVGISAYAYKGSRAGPREHLLPDARRPRGHRARQAGPGRRGRSVGDQRVDEQQGPQGSIAGTGLVNGEPRMSLN